MTQKNNRTAIGILFGKLKDGTFREMLEDWKWILSYTRRHWKAVVLYTLLGIISATLSLASSVAGKYTIDIITGFQTHRLVTLLIIMIGSGLMSLIFDSLLSRYATKLSIRILGDIQADVFRQIMDADWLAVSRFSNGDLLNRLSSDVHTVSGNAVSWLPNILINIYRFLATLLVLLYYDAVMALIAFVSAPILLLLSRSLIRKQRQHGEKMRAASSQMMSFESETFYNFDTIKSFGATELYNRRLQRNQDDYAATALDYNRFSIKTNVFLQIMNLLVQFLSFGYCLFLLWTNAITYGTMTLFLQQRSALSGTFNAVLSVIPAFLNSSISAHRIRELTELPREIRVSRSSQLDALASQGFTVELKDLDFAYGDGTDVLHRSSLTARPGQIVALVGASGEGKTTLIRLILGLVHPQHGQAVLAGADGTQVEMNTDTRHYFSYVPQGNSLMSGTIAENLRLGNENATDEELIAALKSACAWDFVQKLPDGLYATVGERGHGLSEGQAQRIAIARAIVRNAPVLLLDEATSALDVATERQVLRSIIQAHPNKTCIVTTHRPSVLNLCQTVYRVENGTVVELNKEQSAKLVMDF